MAKKKASRKKAIDPREIRFAPHDFERFRPEVQRNPEYNAERLEVRRKLDTIGKYLCQELSNAAVAEAGGGPVDLVSRASLHHPYRFNAFKVESQWVYLSRSDKARRAIKSLLGVELGKDLDQNYVHVLLVTEVHQHGLELALRIHQNAWWDGENLKRRLARADAREELAALLRPLAGYGLRIHDYKRVHECSTIDAEEIRDTFKYYTPGEHWLHIAKTVERDTEWLDSEECGERLRDEFVRLLPLYRYTVWTPENNHLFSS